MDSNPSYTINEFCRAEKISRATYYNLPAESRPKTYQIGKLQRISHEARVEWRRKLEAGEIKADTRLRSKAPAETEAA